MADLNVEKQFNTLKTYKVATNDLLKLTLFNDYHQAPMSTIRSAKRQTVSEICRFLSSYKISLIWLLMEGIIIRHNVDIHRFKIW